MHSADRRLFFLVSHPPFWLWLRGVWPWIWCTIVQQQLQETRRWESPLPCLSFFPCTYVSSANLDR